MKMTTAKLRSLALCSTAAAAIITPSQALAQDLESDESAAETTNTIIVTASKREATLQETPIAVSVTSAEQIANSQARDLNDLQTLVPSLRVNQLQSSANTNFIIRGFGNGANNAGIEPSVGVFIDGVYRSRSAAQIGDLPNLQRVEVLRGPQSTLFGKNASAGIISIVTRAPQFEFGGSAELSYGNFNAVVARADITGPISDSLAFSLAGNINKRDGYVEDIIQNVDNNERNRWGVRGQLLFEANPDLSFRMIGDYDKIDENCCSVVNLVDGPTGNAIRALGGQIISNDRFGTTNALNFVSENEIENYGVSLQMDWAIGDIDVTAIGAYRGVRSFGNQDVDFTSADIVGESSGRGAIDTLTMEWRAASNFDGPLNFLVGAFYFNEDIETNGTLTYGADFKGYADLLTGGAYSSLEPTLRALVPGIPAGTFGGEGQGRMTNFLFDNEAISAFGQLDFEPVDGLTFTVGGNYTSDRKSVISNNVATDVFSSIDLVQAGVNAGVPAVVATDPTFNPFLALRGLQFIPPFLNFPNAVEDGRTKDNEFTYTLRVSYDFPDNVSIYATHATGFKASSFNLSTDSRPFPADFIPGSPFQSPPPADSPIRDAGLAVTNLSTGTRFADPEEAKVYEIGVKGQWEGFAFNLALFDQTLDGFQGNVFTGTGFVLGNAERQSVRGFEFDGSVSPIPELTFTAALTYLDAEYDSFVGGTAFNPATLSTQPTDLTGLRPAGIPEWSMTFGGTYNIEFDAGHVLTLHADFLHESNTQIAEGLPAFRREVNQLNSTVSFKLENGLEFAIWGRNLTDEAYTTTVFPGVAQAGTLNGYRNFPRTYGALVRFTF
ncbi:TonB-dependent receptor domain-containing protein [Erythrobacter sp. Alg231-14]|uniref:TonB-dependent receptor domain-containing protein n=1 Tax=Erythrobacter sp. Alg231-14 TaxID=1922225 RepID=UPI000D54DF1F